jgi:hypothetical protein
MRELLPVLSRFALQGAPADSSQSRRDVGGHAVARAHDRQRSRRSADAFPRGWSEQPLRAAAEARGALNGRPVRAHVPAPETPQEFGDASTAIIGRDVLFAQRHTRRRAVDTSGRWTWAGLATAQREELLTSLAPARAELLPQGTPQGI